MLDNDPITEVKLEFLILLYDVVVDDLMMGLFIRFGSVGNEL
jgi:hypothetical protein